MTIIGLLIFLVIAGVALYLIPMEPAIKATIVKIVTVVAVLWVLFWLLTMLGVMPNLHRVK